MLERRFFLSGLAALTAVALPSAVTDALSVDPPSKSAMQRLPIVFDPAAFCTDLIDAGFQITACRPVLTYLDDDEDLRPGYHITPADGGGFGRRYREVMRRWSVAMDACPDHVEQVVAFSFHQRSGAAA